MSSKSPPKKQSAYIPNRRRRREKYPKMRSIHPFHYVYTSHSTVFIMFVKFQHNSHFTSLPLVSSSLLTPTDSGIVQRCIKAFAEPINQLLFSTFTLDSRSLVVSSCNQIKIYDENFRKKFEYSSKDSRIHLVKFIPGDETGRLAVVLCSNVICILSSSLRLIRHYDPVKARNKYVQRFRQKVEKLNYSESQPAEFVRRAHNVKLKSNADNVISSVTRDYSNGLVTDMSFSSDGRHLVVSFLDGFIMLCSTSLWDVRKLIKYPDGLYARQCDFMPFAMTTEQLNETTNKLLLTLTSNDELMLMSFVDLNAETLDSRNDTFNYAIAANGRLLLDVQRKGEVLVYNMESFLRQKSTAEAGVESTEKNGKHESNYQWNVELGRIQTKVISLLFFHIFPQPHKADLRLKML